MFPLKIQTNKRCFLAVFWADIMQASTWANGQLVAQPTHRPHFNPNTHNNNGSNRLYIISNGGSLVGHFAIQQTSAQRENATNFHQGYHPNSTQSPTLAYPPDVTVIPAQELQTAACVGRTQNLRKTQNVAEVKSPQEGALTFNVLSDFNFKEVSKNEDSRTDSAADGNTVIDKNEEQTPALKKRGLWREELGHLPQAQSSSGPESHGLFQEFKRRHKMKQKSPE
uniref:Uncharacterized protein n=1 Tax=Knipowitschia caucasica TaxID=637954 RepID=A0AAV2KZP7_KNICA